LDPSKDFETTILVKMNAPQVLRKELSKSNWKKEKKIRMRNLIFKDD